MPEMGELLLLEGRELRRQAETEDVQELEGLGEHGVLEGIQQHPPREAQGEAAQDGDPEDQLLARVELPRRRVRALGEEAAALGQPDQIVAVGYVVHHPQHEDDHQARHEGESHPVVRPLTGFGDSGEGVLADHLGQEIAPIEQVEAGQGQDDEGNGGQPMADPLDCVEALDQLAGGTMLNLDAAAQREEERQKDDHPEHHPDAVDRQWPVAQGAPALALGLDQDARLRVRDRDVTLCAHPDLAPELGIAGVAEHPTGHETAAPGNGFLGGRLCRRLLSAGDTGWPER